MFVLSVPDLSASFDCILVGGVKLAFELSPHYSALES